MKYIVIYAYNEEIADLKDYAQRLTNKGARVIFHNLAHLELYPKADAVMTFARYLPRVKEFCAGMNAVFSALDEQEDEALVAQEEPAQGLTIELPIDKALPVVEEPQAELSVEELAVVEDLVAASDEVVITVAETETPTTTKRGRK